MRVSLAEALDAAAPLTVPWGADHMRTVVAARRRRRAARAALVSVVVVVLALALVGSAIALTGARRRALAAYDARPLERSVVLARCHVPAGARVVPDLRTFPRGEPVTVGERICLVGHDRAPDARELPPIGLHAPDATVRDTCSRALGQTMDHWDVVARVAGSDAGVTHFGLASSNHYLATCTVMAVGGSSAVAGGILSVGSPAGHLVGVRAMAEYPQCEEGSTTCSSWLLLGGPGAVVGPHGGPDGRVVRIRFSSGDWTLERPCDHGWVLLGDVTVEATTNGRPHLRIDDVTWRAFDAAGRTVAQGQVGA